MAHVLGSQRQTAGDGVRRDGGPRHEYAGLERSGAMHFARYHAPPY